MRQPRSIGPADGASPPLSRGRETFLLVLGGGVLALAFPPVDLWPLAFVGLLPLFFVLKRTRVTGFWSAFRPGLVAGAAFFTVLVYWIVFLGSDVGDDRVLMASALLLLVLLESFYWGLFSAGAVLVDRRTSLPDWLVLPLMWVGAEQLRSLFELGFPWGVLGYTGVSIPAAVQFASFTGVFGVSLWMAVVNAVVLGLVLGRRRPPRVVALVLLLSVPLVHGTLTLSNASWERTVRVAVVQPNIGARLKWDPEFKELSFGTLETLTLAAAEEDPDLIIWPETATPSYLLRDANDLSRVAAAARSAGVPILTGFPDLVFDAERGEYRSYNAALLMDADGTVRGKYDKIHLVPFGEAIPFEELFPFLEDVDFGEADFRRGDERLVFETEDVRFSVLICFEAIFPRLVRGFTDDGAELLVNITNDVWYGRTSMPFQHAQMAVMRSIENRRSLARSANSGVSLFADPYGRVISKTPIFERAVLVEDVPVATGRTFYARHGGLVAWLMVGAAVLLLALAVFARRRPATRP
ncbi:MAG: apolipoprotein N-acyltransferase [Candidatus Eisenbacteria bacterium]|nr:apolipoprotein N-acyltransferase [Candidatus Eisenbacteria bacterium]